MIRPPDRLRLSLGALIALAAVAFLFYGFTRPVTLVALCAGLAAIQAAQGRARGRLGWAGVAIACASLLVYQALEAASVRFPTSPATVQALLGRTIALVGYLAGNLILAVEVNRSRVYPRNSALWLPVSLTVIFLYGLLLPYVLSLGWMAYHVVRTRTDDRSVGSLASVPASSPVADGGTP
ncbi:MAG: hypothetical protein WD906_00895 [Anaerolineales bacterium]